MVWENRNRGEIVLGLVKDAIADATYDKLDPILKLLGKLLKLDDSHVALRVATTLPELLVIFEQKRKLPKSTESTLTFLIHKLYDKNPYARSFLDDLYLRTQADSDCLLHWIEQWLLR